MLQLPGYRLVALVEATSQNEVYRGIRESDGEKVIVKILISEYPSASDLRSYQQEYTIGQNLSSPGVVKLYSLEYYQQRPFLVFEDVEGISLKKYLAGRPLPVPQFLAIAIQITKIIGEIHAGNIIHKDINPSNIIINPSTNEVKIIDFGMATQLSRENPTRKNPQVLEGNLSYISPEQTGRMNRAIDYRSDFYSLGVTFYELLTGQLPFTNQDPLELIHCHLAIQPPSPQSICPEIPATVANIVLKLMAKNAEERYQSAWGLLTDLQICQRQFNAQGFIEPFALGSRDFAYRFQIPQKLYGREAEISQLISAFERVTSSPEDGVIVPREIMLISGYSGIGKSVLVAELYQVITAKRGYFISGKFDQLQNHIPYSALIDAFRELIEQILMESEEQLQEWREKLFSALGEQGQIIIDVIPELELIIGPQPAVAEVGLVEAQNRFNLLFKHFIRVFCKPEHPLVLFLDDLQWSDLTTLKFIEIILNDPETKYLFLIGAYRDHEVGYTHPLKQTIDHLTSQGVSVNHIYLKPLNLQAVIQLIAETLHREYTTVTPLAELVLHKTAGNPLFINQFLTQLYREKFLKFKPPSEAGTNWGWYWDIQEIQATNMTDNVVELLVNQLQKLPLATQQHLSLGACIGHTFQLDTLSVVSQKSAEAIAQDLVEAIADGLIIAEEHWQQNLPVYRYRFGHDRIQQAAYSLIPDSLKQKTHLTIGQLLLTHTAPEELDYEIFEILNHFNRSYGLIECERLKVTIAELNLKAGLKAIKATAYPMAINYLRTGLELLEAPESWHSHYQLTRSLYKAIAEAEYLNGNFGQAKQYLDVGLKYSRSNVEKAELYKILIIQSTLMAQYSEAIATGIHALSLLNLNLNPDNLETTTQDKMAKMRETLANLSMDSLLNLPTISDREKEMAVKLLISIDPPTYIIASPLYPLVSVTAVELSIQYGNVAESAKAYANCGLLFGSSLGDYQLGYQLGVLAVNLSQKLGSDSQKCQACLSLGSFIAPWCQPFKGLEQINLAGYQAGLKSGEIQFAGYNLFCYVSNKLIQGLSLPEILKDLNHYLSFAVNSKNQLCIDVLLAIKKIIIPLVGVDAEEIDITSERDQDINLSDREFVERCKSSQSFFALTIYYICQMQLCCLTQDFAQGILYINPAKTILTSIFGFTLSSEYYYYAALIMLNQPNWNFYLHEINKNQETISQWVKSCPKNFQHKLLLLEAEQARRNENILEAMNLYDRAIALAKENEFLQDQALANEMAGYFYLALGKEHFAKIYLSQSYSCYDRWGAKTKLKQLEANYSKYIVQIGSNPDFTIQNTSSYAGDNHINTFLDYAALVKNYQIISRCLDLEQLLTNLMEILIKTAGAQRGYLILKYGDKSYLNLEHWKIEAMGELQGNKPRALLNSVSLEDNLPKSIIQYVIRTKKSLVYQNASQEISPNNDAYLKTHQPKSILCMPLLNQGRIIGLVYLENNLATGVFTTQRMEILQMISTQAAISLENSRLYASLEEKVQQRTEELAQKNQQLSQTLEELQRTQIQLIQSEKMSSLGRMVGGIAHEINNPINFISGNLIHAQNYLDELLELIAAYEEEMPHPGPMIQEKMAAIDLDYLRVDLQELFSSMKYGCDRIAKIVQGLRSFSRLGESEMKPVDIHTSIESSLMLLQGRMNAEGNLRSITVVKTYGSLPEVMCYPAQLNQVFFNLLSNAIDALAELRSHSESVPQIEIVTEKTAQDTVRILIRDNGMGIPEAIKGKIFDPFFTTKPVGQGTGLGLSISYQIIVEQHGGQLTCASQINQGTEFIIEIPIAPRIASK